MTDMTTRPWGLTPHLRSPNQIREAIPQTNIGRCWKQFRKFWETLVLVCVQNWPHLCLAKNPIWINILCVSRKMPPPSHNFMIPVHKSGKFVNPTFIYDRKYHHLDLVSERESIGLMRGEQGMFEYLSVSRRIKIFLVIFLTSFVTALLCNSFLVVFTGMSEYWKIVSNEYLNIFEKM